MPKYRWTQVISKRSSHIAKGKCSNKSNNNLSEAKASQNANIRTKQVPKQFGTMPSGGIAMPSSLPTNPTKLQQQSPQHSNKHTANQGCDGDVVQGWLFNQKIQSRVCACAQRTGAAARESLRQDRSGMLTSLASRACGSAGPYSRAVITETKTG